VQDAPDFVLRSGGVLPGGDDPDDAYTVRPYAVTGGRTVPPSDLPVEALVQALVAPDVTMTPERRRILELTTTQYLSVAELSAHVKLPVPVVRTVLADLADQQKIRLHGLTQTGGYDPATILSVLESVLDGISSL